MKKLIHFFESRKKLTLFMAVVWTVVIFIGCSMPGRELPKIGLFENVDKVIHFTFFAVFFGFWYLITSKTSMYAWLIFVISMIYGFGLEYYQLSFVAGRSFDVWDGVADGLGALCGWGVFWWSRKRNVESQKQKVKRVRRFR